MRRLKHCQLTSALLVFSLIVNSSTWADNFQSRDGLVTGVSHNPLNYQIPQNSNGFSVSAPLAAGSSSFATLSSSPSSFNSGYTPVSTAPSDIADFIAENVLQFGHKIASQLNLLDPYASQSEIFSPLSVMSALSLLMLGAKGKSYQELKHLIGLDVSAELDSNPSKYHKELGLLLNDLQHFTANGGPSSSRRQQAKWRSTPMPISRTKPLNPEDSQQIINVANGLFVQSGYSLNPDYSQIINSVYDSELTQLDYQRKSREARAHINNWVNESTHGKIPQIITGEISKSTNVILASVLYFRGFWETSFFPRSTNEDNFYQDGPNSQPIRVQMMATGGVFPFYDAKVYDCRIIGLPYRGNETTMYVIQPNNSTRQKLRELQGILDARKINEMIDNMALKTTVMVFPKMHFTRTMSMKAMLQNLGVSDIFNGAYSDLSLIGGGGLRGAPAGAAPLSTILHSIERSPSGPEMVYNLPTRQKTVKHQYYDRFHEEALIFSSRFGEIDEETSSHSPPVGGALTEETDTLEKTTPEPSTKSGNETHSREKRQNAHFNLNRNDQVLAKLEADRLKLDSIRSDLFVDEIVHKVDFTVDEQGTEAAAATLTYLHRSGTDVIFRGDAPFLVLIRHDPTKLPLFYGIINKPEL